jgi:hypothetical protein
MDSGLAAELVIGPDPLAAPRNDCPLYFRASLISTGGPFLIV